MYHMYLSPYTQRTFLDDFRALEATAATDTITNPGKPGSLKDDTSRDLLRRLEVDSAPMHYCLDSDFFGDIALSRDVQFVEKLVIKGIPYASNGKSHRHLIILVHRVPDGDVSACRIEDIYVRDPMVISCKSMS
jgi:hypothetical protein